MREYGNALPLACGLPGDVLRVDILREYGNELPLARGLTGEITHMDIFRKATSSRLYVD